MIRRWLVCGQEGELIGFQSVPQNWIKTAFKKQKAILHWCKFFIVQISNRCFSALPWMCWRVAGENKYSRNSNTLKSTTQHHPKLVCKLANIWLLGSLLEIEDLVDMGGVGCCFWMAGTRGVMCLLRATPISKRALGPCQQLR